MPVERASAIAWQLGAMMRGRKPGTLSGTLLSAPARRQAMRLNLS